MVLGDITQLGKDSGMHSFEQVGGCACMWVGGWVWVVGGWVGVGGGGWVWVGRVGVGGCVTKLFNQEYYNWQMWCLNNAK